MITLVWLAMIAMGWCATPGSALSLHIPVAGEYGLTILSPTLLELSLVNTKPPNAPVSSWNWVDGNGNFVPPNASSLKVISNGQTNPVTSIGFRRRPVYAPLSQWDLRVGNWLYVKTANPIVEGQNVTVINDGTLWPTNMQFSAVATPLRYSPAIHVNQEGYMPSHPKKGLVGYYLGSMGEMPLTSGAFSIVEDPSGAAVFQGTLTVRRDVGFQYSPTPYQEVYAADFSSLNTPGRYRLVVPGLGASAPFRIDNGVGLNFARTYALGVLHQRSGFDVAFPFTRFTHAADHTAPSLVPTNSAAPFQFTWETIASYANQTNTDNPPQIAPRLTNPGAQLFPFRRQGTVDVSGGHFEAANYSKVAWNSAMIVHVLMFAVDSLPGVAALDNLGLPESGDGISDALQEAKWEADCLAKMQDSDGGFYYMIHPLEREYEYNVLPENGDQQVVWPKNTGSSAAAVAALAQCASSPSFKAAYPSAASNYWAKAVLGWTFLTNALAAHGFNGAYQRIMHFDDFATHTDDLAWAACEMFLATSNTYYQSLLESWFPNPTSPSTMRWGWWKMYASYGNAARSYAYAARSGRLSGSQLNADYLAKCQLAMIDSANDALRWSTENAYGSSFPDSTKRARSAGWYYSSEQAFDIVAAYDLSPRADYLEAILANFNYEAGCNPVNASYVTGLGLKRQTEVVDQYSANDHRILPKIGVPIGNIQAGFGWAWMYGGELDGLCSPPDGAVYAPYPFYDRWSDFWNVSTEASTSNTARCLAAALWLACRSPGATSPWRFTAATVSSASGQSATQTPVTLTMNVASGNLSEARITWEVQGREPAFGGASYVFTPQQTGTFWVEAEAHWPDGKRAFATNRFIVSATPPPQLTDPKWTTQNFSFKLVGSPNTVIVIETSPDLRVWQALSTNTIPGSGQTQVTDSSVGSYSRRFYRAVNRNGQ